MANTPNYNLKKVEYTEIADIPGHFNANFDTIDTVMKNNADAAVAAEDNAKSYASGLIGALSNLLTTAKNNIVAAVNEIFGKVDDVEADLLAHKADFASYAFGSRPYTATYTELYLDEVNGDDSNNGLTQNTAVKTWSKLRSLIPVFLTRDLTIKIIGDYSGSIVINGIFNTGNIYDSNIIIEGITQNKDNHNISFIRMTNVLVPITVRHLTISSTTFNATTACLAPTFQYVTINTDSATYPAIRADKGNLTVRDSEINSTEHACIIAGELGVVFSRDNTGQGRYGLWAFPGGTIIKYGTQPTGTVSDERADEGGLIR